LEIIIQPTLTIMDIIHLMRMKDINTSSTIIKLTFS